MRRPNKLYLMRGLPGSGKSYKTFQLISEVENTVRVNKDSIRLMLYGHERGGKKTYRPDLEHLVKNTEATVVKELLQNGYNVVVDDTNLTEEYFLFWRDLSRDLKCQFESIEFFDVPIETCIERDSKRKDSVGRLAICEMAARIGLFHGQNKKVELDVPYIVCDLDGTLADISHREEMLKSSDFNWSDFFDRMVDDVPREEVKSIIDDSYPGVPLIIVTARPESHRIVCDKWLSDWGIKYHTLLMRMIGDKRPDWVVKQEIINDYLEREKILIWIDDRPSVIRQVRANNISVCDVGLKVEF